MKRDDIVFDFEHARRVKAHKRAEAIGKLVGWAILAFCAVLALAHMGVI